MLLLPLFCILAVVSSAPSTEVPHSSAPAEETSKVAAPLPSSSTEGATKEQTSVSTTPAGEEPKHSGFSKPSKDENPPQPVAPSGENSKKTKNTNKPVLGHNVEEYDYQIPEGMYKEIVDSNDWIWFLRYPEYTLDFHFYCVYRLVKGDEVERLEPGDAKDCLCTVELSYWIEDQRIEILLDTYSIPFKDGTEALTESSIVISHPKDNIHNIALAMKSGKCKQMQYTVDDSFKVEISEKDTDCKEVEKMKLENDAWTEANIPKKGEKKSFYDDSTTGKDSESGSVPSADTKESTKNEPDEEVTSFTTPKDSHSAGSAHTNTIPVDSASADTPTTDTPVSIVDKAKNLAATVGDTSSAKHDSISPSVKDHTQLTDTPTKDTSDSIVDKAKSLATTIDDTSSARPNSDSPSVKDSTKPTDTKEVVATPNSQNDDASSPEGKNTGTAGTSDTLIMPMGSVIASNYILPIGPFREHPFSNHWVSLDKHPIYSLNFFLYCPYELEQFDFDKLTVRHANLEECRPVIRLFKYSSKFKREIVLDTYKIKEEYINQEVMNSIDVKVMDENKAVVKLTMVNNMCRIKTYEVLPTGNVKAELQDIECEDVTAESPLLTEELVQD